MQKDQQFESKLIIKDRNSCLKILNQVLGDLRISTESQSIPKKNEIEK